MRWTGHELVEAGELVLTPTSVRLCGGEMESSVYADGRTGLICLKCGGGEALDWKLGLFDGFTCRRARITRTERQS